MADLISMEERYNRLFATANRTAAAEFVNNNNNNPNLSDSIILNRLYLLQVLVFGVLSMAKFGSTTNYVYCIYLH